MKRHAIIVGGGIGGPALALFLKKVGITSAVYEAHEKDEAAVGVSAGDETRVGGGFQVAPNGLAVLHALGLAERLAARAAPLVRYRFVKPDGTLIATFPNGRRDVNRFEPVACLRSVLGRLLMGELEREGIPVHYRKRFVDLTQTNGQVVARFEDESSAEGTFLVGADGMHSRVRKVAIPDAQPARYDGLVGFAGALELTPEISRGIEQGALTFVLGQSGHFGYDLVTDTLFNWWTHLPTAKEPTKADLKAMNADETRALLGSRFGSWHEPVPTAIRQTKDKDFKYAALYYFPPLPTWHAKNVMLIGDAAHTMSPSAGLGASLALEDAMYLAKLLRGGSELETVFTTFERDRRPRMKKVAALVKQRHARERASLNRFQVAMRDRLLSVMLPLVGERGLRWQYEYQIPWD